jgi:hypothetical protein
MGLGIGFASVVETTAQNGLDEPNSCAFLYGTRAAIVLTIQKRHWPGAFLEWAVVVDIFHFSFNVYRITKSQIDKSVVTLQASDAQD